MFIVAVVGVIVLGVLVRFDLLQQLGQMPKEARLTRIMQSPNFRDGSFQNISDTPSFAEGYTPFGIFKEFFFTKFPQTIPDQAIPNTKTDLKQLPLEEDVLVWMGHSSYYFQLEGKRFLVDPVLSGDAAPLPKMNRSFEGADIYTVGDFPEIDYLLISHDHYDHLDYYTIKALQPKVKQVICGLGVGQHFEYWGYTASQIVEKDWYEEVQLSKDMVVKTHPARHFSGRFYKRNNTLWMSYALITPTYKLYIGGDSGYDNHFKEAGNLYGPFDLAILENGQYNKAWHYIHCLPDETLQAAVDVRAKRVLPVHSSKFKLANHTWFEPLDMLTKLNEQSHNLPMLTPIIGQKVSLRDTTQVFDKWWKELVKE